MTKVSCPVTVVVVTVELMGIPVTLVSLINPPGQPLIFPSESSFKIQVSQLPAPKELDSMIATLQPPPGGR